MFKRNNVPSSNSLATPYADPYVEPLPSIPQDQIDSIIWPQWCIPPQMDLSCLAVPEYDMVFNAVCGWNREEHNVFDVGMEAEAGGGDWDKDAVFRE